MIKLSKVGAACALLGWLGSCTGEGGDSASLDTESVEVALTAIPASTRCIRFTAFSGAREYTQAFDVTGLTSLTAQVRGLPSSQALSMTADAFAVACTAVTPTTQATWVTSLPVAVTLTPGVVPVVSFVLRPTTGVNGDVEFLFFAATPSSRVFPATAVGAILSQTFTIQNIGPAVTGALAVTLTGTGASQFTMPPGISTCGPALAVNATCSITVSFMPSSAGAKAALLVVTAAPGGTIGMPLSGTGVQAPVLALAPATQSFGTVAVGKSSPLVTYTLTNSGGATTVPVAVTSSDATFVLSASTCTDVLAQAATCTFKVAFVPTAVATKTATLTATAGTFAATASVTGVGAAAPALTLTPSVLALGTLFPGTSSQNNVTVKNVGGFPLSALSVFVGGGASAPFSVVGTSCGMAELAPNATCTFLLNSNPTDPGQATAPVNATMLVTAGGANPASVMGTVSGTVSWPLQPSPTSFHFGTVKVGTTASVVIRFTNISPTVISPLTIATGTPVFTITSNSCGAGFGPAPGSFCDVVVRYNVPATAGVASVDFLRATPVPGVGATGVPVTLRGTSAP